MSRSHFGSVRKLDSGKFQPRYVGPDGVRRTAGTHATKKLALAALAAIATDINTQGAGWVAPGTDPAHDERTRVKAWADSKGITLSKSPSFGSFARDILAMRSSELAPRTLEGYESLLTRHLLPDFGWRHLDAIKVREVDKWWAEMGSTTGKVTRRNAYFLLSNLMTYAVRYGHIAASPCVIKDAGKAVAEPRPHLPVADFRRIVTETPQSLHAALWTAFGAHVRLGELCGLNVGDVDLQTGMISIERQAQQVRGQGVQIRETKTGNRRSIKMLRPAHDALRVHLEGNTDPASAPLFRGPKGGRLTPQYIRNQWRRAASAVGLPDAHLHDIRHTGLTHVAAHGSTKEVMNRGGHTTSAAALRYQHSTAERDSAVADAASAALA